MTASSRVWRSTQWAATTAVAVCIEPELGLADDSEEHIIIAIAIGFDYSARGPSYMLGVSCGRGTEGRVGSRRDLCEVS